MITSKELQDNQIYTWDTFASKLGNPDLLLGNGFTLNFSTKFSYPSLFDIFLKNCDPEFIDLFKSFGTTNFEIILRYLKHAERINQILGQDFTLILNSIEELKNGLIKSIEQVHPRNSEIDFDNLRSIALQLANFGDIFTTNYDLYLYHILMLTNDLRKTKTDYIGYQDYFWGNQAPSGFNQFMDYQGYVYKDIYYLHGALFIYKNTGNEIKLLKTIPDEELIESISSQIRNSRFPIFVSEGEAKDKITSINGSRYLRFCLDALSSKDNSIVIFGNALHEIDLHIIDAIKQKQRDIIYCIYIGNRTIESVQEEKYKFKAKFEYYQYSIEFVDSSTVFV